MKARITVITIAVNDLEESMRFYQRMGLQTEGIIGTEFEEGRGAVVLFNLKGGLILSLYPKQYIA
jgi:hypothetical protein